jgi:formylglycine-generating enzyme required for sulfatase activity
MPNPHLPIFIAAIAAALLAPAVAFAQSLSVPPVPAAISQSVTDATIERLQSELEASRKALRDLQSAAQSQGDARKSAIGALEAQARALQAELDVRRRADERETADAAARVTAAQATVAQVQSRLDQARQRVAAEQSERLRQEQEARRQAEAAKPVIPPGTEKRVALVMGNARYADRPLRNPVNDSALMARTLQALGFEVQVANDVDRRGMLTALRDFENRSRGADVALFYFAGHGAQVGGANYLIPVNAGIRVENDVPDEAIDAASVLRRIEDTRVKVGLVVLDACRDNPYPGASRSTARGLARMSVPTGTIVAYATAPGSTAEDGTGDNGTYTAALARHLATPGLDIKDIFDRTAQEVERLTNGKQRPREEIGLRGRFALLEAPGAAPTLQMAAVSPAAAATTAALTVPGTAGQGSLPACVAGEAISGRCLATRMPWTRGSLFTGEVWNGRAVGPGKLYFANGDVFTGEFDSMVDDRVNGTGTLKTAEWTYEGALRNGSFHGQGTQRFLDGRPERSGVWVAGRLQSAPDVRQAGEVFKDCAECPEMVVIPAGRFLMGSPPSEAGRSADEGPQRWVDVARFAMGKFEVTQRQWEAVMGSNPSHFRACGPDCPVENVSWNDAQEFVRRLSQRTGQNYRLPSEAEWEYAARAGTTTAYFWGDAFDAGRANNNSSRTVPVGRYGVNAFGLHDIYGNVWEWVQDVWRNSYVGAPSDGSAWVTGGDQSWRVLRGGSWGNSPLSLRSAFRVRSWPVSRDYVSGFRIARTF